MSSRAYYYGEGTDHKLWLEDELADVINKIRILEYVEETGMIRVNLNAKEIEIYDRASALLNNYNDECGPVHVSDEYLQNNDILRPVK